MNNEREKQIELSTNQARAGRRVKGMPIVLGLSTIAAIIVGVIAVGLFA